METNKNIDRLLEMLDHPEAYSEQEILDLINQDDETRETYGQLVRAKRVSHHHHSAVHPADIDQAWQQFEQQHLAQPMRNRLWLKAVALLAGIVLLSGIAWATVYTMRHNAMTQQTTPKDAPTAPVNSDAVGPRLGVADTMTVNNGEPIVFDNVPLDQMITEIAVYYGKEVAFKNGEAHNLRFHYVWNKSDGLSKVLDDLNRFESVTIEQTGHQLIVQ